MVGELKARAKMISTTEEIAQVRLLTWLWQHASDFACGRESMHMAFPGAPPIAHSAWLEGSGSKHTDAGSKPKMKTPTLSS